MVRLGQLVCQYMSPVLMTRLSGGLENFMAELRTVTVMFLSVSSLLANKTGLRSLKSAKIKKLITSPSSHSVANGYDNNANDNGRDDVAMKTKRRAGSPEEESNKPTQALTRVNSVGSVSNRQPNHVTTTNVTNTNTTQTNIHAKRPKSEDEQLLGHFQAVIECIQTEIATFEVCAICCVCICACCVIVVLLFCLYCIFAIT